MSRKSKLKVFVIGGGASGMMAALSAKYAGANVTILERNARIGKKILATGNGRCNYTNVSSSHACYNGKRPEFAYNALSVFDVSKTIGFFEKLGITPSVEDAGKVFPMSGQASSVLDVLLYELNKSGVDIVCNAFVKDIKRNDKGFSVGLEDGRVLHCDRIILACGGKAMPSSGSDGNGFELAKKLGHNIVDIFPALVQLKLKGNFFKQIDGVKFVGTCELLSGNKHLQKDRGDILFGNYGVSGPPIFQISRKAGELIHEKQEAIVKISVIDNMTQKELENYLTQRFKNMPEKSVDFSLVGFINKRLIPVMLKQAGISDLKKPVSMLTSGEKKNIATILQDWRFQITGTKSWPSAQVTAGGVDTDEVNPYSLESKLVKGLFLCGEILDIDGACGGYNLQWAWSSGFVAGKSAVNS
ncbi:MAG TPA: NAD(P)/FAD-dependent oxidoreductase [Thermoanaerobacterales bacterium]|jgi:predicted Rossmann fold flavoprotein|nr:NAD(P)/FAD-dependent oxidoreductase [Thermoanaerobacterales bacterium]